MPLVKAETVVDAPKDAVWEVLADFGNVHDYTSQVKSTIITTEESTGVGAIRQCQLAPMGATSERILEFEPGERLVIALYDVKGLPIKGSTSTFTLEAIDADHTRLSFEAEVEAKGGILSGFVDRRLEKRLPRGSQAMIDDFAAAAVERSAATG